ncbi:sensor histidine kinase, partial [Sphingomonas sp. SRS2]|uniref:sensor histidine kinase n=1 Tax=Sphingomonas sp. SRS2 TaxID=133190 RepID=UPI000618424F
MTALVHSLSFRLALTYVGLFAASLLVVLGSFYLVVIYLPLESAKSEVQREARSLQNSYIVDGAPAVVERLRARERAPNPRRAFHAFIDREGHVLSANLPSWPNQLTEGWWRLEADDYLEGDEIDYEALTIDHGFDDGARLLVGRDIEDVSEIEEVLASGTLVVLAAALVVGILGGGLMSLAIGRRIEAVSATARRVMAGDLSQRVPVRGSGDDFDRLAETLNLMLTRIEEALEAVRRVSDSVAHELRTPLARLKADLEDAATEGHEARLASAISEANRLEKIFDAVLRIARIEAGRHDATTRPVDLSTLLEDVVDYYLPAADERRIDFVATIEPGLIVNADGDLIFQAMANLIDNAIKYAPARGKVALTAQLASAAVIVTLDDNGPGIPPEHRARVTERFYRAPSVSDQPGEGLGLSLVAAVAALHGSAIIFEDGEPGLRVRWTIPRAV